MTRELGDRMVADERFKLLTFTGSPSVGWRMKERAGKKKVVLELGGNAGVIVDQTADLDWAVKRILVGAYAYAGQVLHQRAADVRPRGDLGHVHGAVRGGRRDAQAGRSARSRRPTSARWSTSTRPGGPSSGSTRPSRWVARSSPAARRDGNFFPPTVLTDVPVAAQVCSNEAFAPLVVAFPFTDMGDAIARVNDSMFGLQTGVFTNDLAGAWQAFSDLEVGGVIVNDIPTYRIDHMPYGGVKDSGQGREGLRWAIEDMTELRIMVLAQPS